LIRRSHSAWASHRHEEEIGGELGDADEDVGDEAEDEDQIEVLALGRQNGRLAKRGRRRAI
jgi:hypothetical protein